MSRVSARTPINVRHILEDTALTLGDFAFLRFFSTASNRALTAFSSLLLGSLTTSTNGAFRPTLASSSSSSSSLAPSSSSSSLSSAKRTPTSARLLSVVRLAARPAFDVFSSSSASSSSSLPAAAAAGALAAALLLSADLGAVLVSFDLAAAGAFAFLLSDALTGAAATAAGFASASLAGATAFLFGLLPRSARGSRWRFLPCAVVLISLGVEAGILACKGQR